MRPGNRNAIPVQVDGVGLMLTMGTLRERRALAHERSANNMLLRRDEHCASHTAMGVCMRV